jgi:hypothetical protein
MNKSPFPGMDPYLEGEMWQEFHERLANQISTQLMPLLRPKYVALLEKYYVVNYAGTSSGIMGGVSKQGIYPDVHVAKVKEAVAEYKAMTAPAVELISPVPEEIPVLRIEIRDVAERRLVTIIEILSPANKQGKGLEEYLTKRAAILQTSTHLLELDLLRAGERIPLLGGELPPAPYYVFLSRFTNRPWTEVWPVQLRDPLPTVPVPLLPPDPEAPLALQPAINACFELVRYHEHLLDYTQPPPLPPLTSEDLAWAEAVVSRRFQ